MCHEGTAITSTGAASITSTSSTVSVEDVKFTGNAIDHATSGTTALALENVNFLNTAISAVTTFVQSSHYTNTGGNILLTSADAQSITHQGTNSGSKDLLISSASGAVKVEDLLITSGAVTSSSAITLTSTSSTITVEDAVFTGAAIANSGSAALTLEGVTFLNQAISTVKSLTMSGDLTNSAGNILMTSNGAQAITHAGGGSAHLTITSTSGNVVVESVSFAEGVLTSTSAITVDSDVSVSAENVKFTTNAIEHKSGSSNALTLEDVTFVNTAISGVTTIIMEDDLTLENANSDILMTATGAQAITHTGASTAHLSITSTNGAVNVESWKFTGGDVTATSAITITSTSSTVTIEGAQFTDNAIDQSGGSGALTIESVALEDANINAGAITATESITTSKANGGIILSSTAAQVITHTGASDADLTISSTNGKVCVETVCIAGATVTSSAALSIDASDATHSVSVEDASFKANTVTSASGTYLSVEDVRFQDGAVSEVRSIAINPNNAAGSGLTIANTQTQTSGNLVSITGAAGEIALAVVTGITDFGGKFTHGAAGVTKFATETATKTAAYRTDQEIGPVTGDAMTGLYTITGVTLAGGMCSDQVETGNGGVVRLQSAKIVSANTLVLLEVASYTGTTFTNGVPFVVQNTVESGALLFNICNSGANAMNGDLKVSWMILGG
jgi:hypothetical protein